MGDNEIVNVLNVRRFAKYSGYLRSFKCEGPVDTTTTQDTLTMDACYDDHFTEQNNRRDLSKAYVSFRAHAQAALAATACVTTNKRKRSGAPAPCCISTGKWGCGVFGGIPAHKFVQQVLAANLADANVAFSTFSDPQDCDLILKTLHACKPTSLAVARALFSCRHEESFVKDFEAALKLETSINSLM